MPSSFRLGSLPMSPTISRYSSSVRLCWSRILLSIMAGLRPAGFGRGRAAGRGPSRLLGRGRARPASGLEAPDQGLEKDAAVLAAEQGLRGPLRMGHQAEDVAGPV